MRVVRATWFRHCRRFDFSACPSMLRLDRGSHALPPGPQGERLVGRGRMLELTHVRLRWLNGNEWTPCKDNIASILSRRASFKSMLHVLSLNCASATLHSSLSAISETGQFSTTY